MCKVLVLALAAAGLQACNLPWQLSAKPAINFSSSELQRFEFHGAPIHPAWVQKLWGDMASRVNPIAAVDLSGCEKEGSPPPTRGPRGAWRHAVKGDSAEETFDYRHVGCSPGGTHVLEVEFWGGGSGRFRSLLLVRLERDDFLDEEGRRPRTLMSLVGHYSLGDRDDGVIRMSGGQVLIGASRYRLAETEFRIE